jgi:hypothetical protein
MALALWIFIPIIFFSIAKTKMQGYILFISPALFIVTGWFFMELKNNLVFRISNKGFKTLKYLLLVLIIALPFRYCYERTNFGFGSRRSNEYPYAYKKFSGELDSKCVVLNVPQPIEFMFYNNCIAYSASSISSEEKERILRKGYRTFILNLDKIQEY